MITVACIAAVLVMMGGHTYNSYADYVYGLDRGSPKSTEKWYTRGSGVIAAGEAKLYEVLVLAIFWWAIAAVLVWWITHYIGSPWPWFGYALGVSAGIVYAPGFMKGLKYVGFPEWVGLVGFGIGGVAVGYASMSAVMNLPLVVLVGAGVAGPWATVWIIDQWVDAESDIRKGVYNIAHVAYKTSFPVWGYLAVGLTFSFLTLLFLITIGYLSPWVFLAILCLPLWLLAMMWLHYATQGGPFDSPQVRDKEALDKGVKYGLLGVFVYMMLVTLGQGIALL